MINPSNPNQYILEVSGWASEQHHTVTLNNINGDATAEGIATVHQDLAMVPLMSVSRNFFVGNEPKKRFGFCSAFESRPPERTLPDGGMTEL